VIDTVGVGDQRVASAGQIQQPVPGRVVPSQPRDLQRQDDPDLAQRHLGDQRLEPLPLAQHGARHTEVGVDDADLATWPAQLDRTIDQVVLPLGGLDVALELGHSGLPDIDRRRA
jgi:hypothetical protein